MKDLTNKGNIKAKITEIEWERIFLIATIKVEVDEGNINTQLSFYMVNGLFKAKGEMEIVGREGDYYKVRINVTNNGEKRCYPLGSYRIAVCSDDALYAYAYATNEIIENVDNYSRNFLYANRKKVYTVTFFVDDDFEYNGYLPLIIYMMNSSSANMQARFSGGVCDIIKKYMRAGLSYIKNRRASLKKYYKKRCKKIKNSKKTILFMTEQSDTLGANLQAVLNRMKIRGMEADLNILTSARPASYITQSYKSNKALIRKIAQSDMVIIDDHVPLFDWLQLNSKTELVQLWHAGAGFKSSGYSRWGHKGCPSPVSCHRQYKYGIAGSKNIAHFFSEVWGINDEQVLPTGMPRMDEYLDAEYRAKKLAELREKFPICNGKKVILFAPTYRGKNRKEAYYPYDLIDFNELYRVCADEYVVLFKMHPWVNQPIQIEEKYADKFIDVGSYPNINDMFYFTDLLITDYSSNIFEYSLMKKPMLFFAFDKTEYAFSRGFHRDYEESAPGKVCYEFADLIAAIENKDFDYEKVQKYIDHHFDYIDTHASDRVIDWIILGQQPEEIRQTIEDSIQQAEKLSLLDFDPEKLTKN